MSVAKVPPPQRPAAVYRLRDADGNLLYIGSAYDPGHRCRAHRSESWWPDVASRTDEWHESRGYAYAAELDAIVAEEPQRNRAGSRWWSYPVTEATLRSAEESRARGRVQSEAYRFQRQVREEAEADGVPPSEAWRLSKRAFVDFLDASGLFDPWVARLRKFSVYA
ncbi:hypothetical protein [Streptomyces sp. NPDC092952]|uniref:hypothetical protein n=1 Tax=Streptomyces sp. NPDC092952 TaxID=3366018 RepID=UPI0038272D46